jgi:hypothetical protein
MAASATETLIGTMNMLGDAYNPLEFLAVDDAAFMGACSSFEARARAVKWDDLDAQGLGELVEACGGNMGALNEMRLRGEAWAAMDEVSLEDDNKYFDHRMNLIVFAMRRFDKDTATCAEAGPLVWELAAGREWFDLLKGCCIHGGTYKQSPCLLAWDLLCCVVASDDSATFAETCRASYLNPDNTARHAQIFVDAAVTTMRAVGAAKCVLGLQEFPQAGTPRAVVFEAAFKEAGFALVRAARSCAVAHAGFAACEVLADGGDAARGVDADAVMRTLTRDADGEPRYDKKTTSAFEGTTAAKVLSVRLDGVAYHALHAKEPKTIEAARLLARFLAAHAEACGAGPFAWLVDTNLAKDTTDAAFRTEVETLGFQVSASVPTTSKRRSRLHGQCYDDAKCHKTVKGPKDKFVVAAGDTLELLPTVPDLADETHPVTLPRASWPTDHAFVAALYVGAAA